MSSDAACGSRIECMDCNCRIGTFEHMEEPHFTDVDGLLAEMEFIGISQALVMHSWASHWSPRLGNAKLDELIGDRDNLYPCYVALPSATGELAPPAEFAAEVRARRGAVRLFPAEHQWDFTPWCAGELLDALAARSVPALIDMGQTNWNQIAAVLEQYRELPLIILGTSYRINRHIYPLFKKYENLYLEVNTHVMTWSLEDISERFGAERLIFGTGLPETEAGGALAQVRYNKLSDADKARIAGGNLRSLLGMEEP